MKKRSFLLIAFLLSGGASVAQSGFLTSLAVDTVKPSGELRCWVQEDYDRGVAKARLTNANLLRDFVEGYPYNWIEAYFSVTLTTTTNGLTRKAAGSNERLTEEQKKLLAAAEPATEIFVEVKYSPQQGRSGETGKRTVKEEVKNVKVKMTVIPEKEAAFPGGAKQLTAYFNKNVRDKIKESIAGYMETARVFFTVAATGKIENPEIEITSGDVETDQLIIAAILQMPVWKPAENAAGEKVRQRFRLYVGKPGC